MSISIASSLPPAVGNLASRRVVRAAALVAVVSMALAAPARAAGLDTVTVAAREVAAGLPVEATVEAVQQATVAAQGAGRILEVRADAGQRVRRGEVLMRIDSREAAGNDAAAQAQLLQAKANFERTRSLREKNFVSQAALDQAEAAYKSAQGTAGASGASLSHSTVTAPISGVVATRHMQQGEMAAPGAALFTVFEPKGMRLIAAIPQYRLAEVRKATSARIEFPESGRQVNAARVEVLPAIDARSHTGTARVYLADADAEGIVPGMAARVRFSVATQTKLAVPPGAILRRGEITGVYVVADDSVPKLHQVRVGEPLANGDIEILAGLKGGERVAIDAIRAGLALRVKKP